MEAKNFIKLDFKKKIAISIVFFLFIIFGVVCFIVVPSIRDIKIIGSNIEEQRMELERKYLKGQSLRGLSEKIEKIENEMQEVDNIFVDRDKGLEFITALEDLAGKNNVNQKINIALNNEPFSSDFKEIPIQLYTQGRLDDQANYLVGLETMKYYVNVESIEISSYSPEIKEESTNTSSYISLLLTVNTYWKR